MDTLVTLYYSLQKRFHSGVKHIDGLPSLALRLYLVPIFWMAGSKKIDLSTLMPYQNTVDWFGNQLRLGNCGGVQCAPPPGNIKWIT